MEICLKEVLKKIRIILINDLHINLVEQFEIDLNVQFVLSSVINELNGLSIMDD